jgi:YjbE family integral membrane protein
MIEFMNGLGVNLQPQFWASVVEIIWINILLSGDNAIVIALACRNLAPKQRMLGMVLGTLAALLLRIAFTGVVMTLMSVPYLKIVGGAALFWIALKLLVPTEESGDASKPTDTVLRAVMVIAVADIVMSLDNVIAVAAAAKGSFALLMFGLGISIPVIVGGATIIMAALNYFPIIIWAGAALLGWLAGEVIATDPVIVEAARALGPNAPEKIQLACSVVGTVGVVLGGLLGRTRRRVTSS